jgi:aminoglycoside phosphotransferase (APT) family kinase protein
MPAWDSHASRGGLVGTTGANPLSQSRLDLAAIPEGSLIPLLDHLAGARPSASGPWREWQIAPVRGGWNNLLYRVTGAGVDLAVKFTPRDARDRADREFGAWQALHDAGLPLAPEPVWLDRDRYELPVVVGTWLAGQVRADLPTLDRDWEKLVQHIAALHTVTPANSAAHLPAAVLNANSADQGRRLVLQEVSRIPGQARPDSLLALIRRFESTHLPPLRSTRTALCRVDHNLLNFVRRPGPWVSVDWEYAGWGDPAFDVAGLLAHAAYWQAPLERWVWFVRAYCDRAGDPLLADRIWLYYGILVVWWAARLARYLYELPCSLDQRLVAQPEGWQADLPAKYRHYLWLADQVCTSAPGQCGSKSGTHRPPA